MDCFDTDFNIASQYYALNTLKLYISDIIDLVGQRSCGRTYIRPSSMLYLSAYITFNGLWKLSKGRWSCFPYDGQDYALLVA